LLGAFSAVQVANRTTTTSIGPAGLSQSNDAITGNAATTGVNGGQSVSGAASGLQAAGLAANAGLACERGKNGGSTDKGVTATSINLATTTVQSGIGASFLGEVKYAMEAIKNKVNRQGGICGRLLNIKYVDDGWEADRGAGYIRNFIHDGEFGLPVGPSSEGLQLVIKSGDITTAGIPVVGTDGMIIDQYKNPWVWPVAVATASSARIMADNAYSRGARKFSIVFDKNYKFGAEAAEAYNNEVRRLTKSNVEGYDPSHGCSASFCGIDAGQSSYATYVKGFKPGDFEAMFLEPTTALTWMSSPGAPTPQKVKIGAAQPLFTRDFANSCQAACNGMWVWTGYKPPIEDAANDPNVRTYVRDLRETKPDADVYNAFTEGGYVGMELLVEALKRVGPNLTRAALQTALDTQTLQTGLTLQNNLSWRPNNHFANATMQAFSIQYSGTFSGWRAQDVVRDAHPEYGIN
jgi:branched-chain amino acid transport system substrate-binding protein